MKKIRLNDLANKHEEKANIFYKNYENDEKKLQEAERQAEITEKNQKIEKTNKRKQLLNELKKYRKTTIKSIIKRLK